MRKTVAKIVCFCLLLVCILGYADRIFAVKYSDGIYSVTKFYEQKENTVDVLVLGSSHAFVDINTGVLWDEYGIASYILAGAVQPMWNTYYYLKEALKTQTPELIVLEAYNTKLERDYADDSTIIKNTFGMKWSKDKLDAIRVSAPKERWAEFLLSYIQYHTRYTELSGEDFLQNKGNALYENWKGFGCGMGTTAFEMRDISDVLERKQMGEKTEEYYRKTIELALDNDIPLLIVVSPYAEISAERQAAYNTASDIAREYDVPFIDYNLLYEEIGMDFSCDALDGGHLNYKGSRKYTEALGSYIKENYDITDRRGDKNYESWEADAKYISAMIKNFELSGTTDLQKIIETIDSSDYILTVSVDGACSTADENVGELFDVIGLPRTGENGIWCVDKSKEFLFTVGWEEATKYMRLDPHDICVSRIFNEDTQKYVSSMIMDNNEYVKVENGVNVLIYDIVTKTIVGSFGIDVNDSYQIIW